MKKKLHPHSVHGSFRATLRPLATVAAAIADQKCLPVPFGLASVARFAIEHLAANLPKYAALFPTDDAAWKYLIEIGALPDKRLIRIPRPFNGHGSEPQPLDVTQMPSVELGEPPIAEGLLAEGESESVVALMSQLKGEHHEV